MQELIGETTSWLIKLNPRDKVGSEKPLVSYGCIGNIWVLDYNLVTSLKLNLFVSPSTCCVRLLAFGFCLDI